MSKIDYLTNLDTKNDPQRQRAYMRLNKAFGYLPVYGPTMLDVETGQRLLEYLLKDFPGYKWVIEVRDSIITVINESLAPDWGFRLKEHLLDNDGELIRHMAGELLERYRVPREAMNKQTMAELPRDLRGNVARTG